MNNLLKFLFNKGKKDSLKKDTNYKSALTDKQLGNLVDAKKLTFTNDELKEKFAKSYTKQQFENLICNDGKTKAIETNTILK